MPCYHFILHGYATWHPDHARGWHQHGARGAIPPSEAIARHRRAQQRWTEVRFAPDLQFQLIEMTLDLCKRRRWRCHAVATNETHIHAVISWRGEASASTVRATLKRLLGMRCAEWRKEPGRQWFSEGGRADRVKDAAHLAELVAMYLPGQGGWLWREGDGSPIDVSGRPN